MEKKEEKRVRVQILGGERLYHFEGEHAFGTPCREVLNCVPATPAESEAFKAKQGGA